MEQTSDNAVLEISRRYEAPPERVWQAWTDPQALSQWFGPGESKSVTRAELDVRPGGDYTIAFRTPDGAGTRMVFRHERFFDRAARDAHERGWMGTIAKLDRWVAAAG